MSWNINSVRLRLDLIRDFVLDYSPDVLCFQETKCRDEDFPYLAFRELGYAHCHVRGEKSYNGVAILSRIGVVSGFHCSFGGFDDARHISVVLEGGLEVHNFYVPAGGDIGDVDVNPKFAHKLRFLSDMDSWFCGERDVANRLLLLGDLNIAPGSRDVWSHRALVNTVSYTEIERERLASLRDNFGWIDAVRSLRGEDELLYSWWSYRARDWAAANRGRRLDHIWVSPVVVDSLHSCEIAFRFRGVERPSDHVPVILDLGL